MCLLKITHVVLKQATKLYVTLVTKTIKLTVPMIYAHIYFSHSTDDFSTLKLAILFYPLL